MTPYGTICMPNLLQKYSIQRTSSNLGPLRLFQYCKNCYKCLFDLARPHITHIAGVQFAFIRLHQTHEVIYILRPLIEKSIEWGGQLWVVDGDIHKAYDNTHYNFALDGLLQHECLRFFAAAFAR